ncbi:MAG: hypothetical protein ACOYEA_02445 [Fermentimonas sp.]|jgi:hypothetical protein
MRKCLISTVLLLSMVFSLVGQNKTYFNSVPVVNGKVVFEQFIVTEQGNNTKTNYAKLQIWARNKFARSPLLSGMRFDEKTNSITVSSGEKLSEPQDMVMSYRLDLSATDAGYLLIVRDISYQVKNKDSVFPKTTPAEMMITDEAVNSGGEKQMKMDAKKSTLDFVNGLFNSL